MKSTIVSNPLKSSLQLILLLAIVSFNFGSGTMQSALAQSASSSTLEDVNGAVALYGVAAVSSPPVNDDFANAFTKTIGTVPYTDSLDTTGAADASDGPAVPGLCDGKSLRKGLKNVWYQFTPGSNQLVYIDTLGSTPPPDVSDSDYDTYIAVWTGPNINNLTLVGCDDDDISGLQSQLALSAVKDTTYYIEVAQFNGVLPNGPLQTPTGGTLQLHVTSFEDVPGNYWAWRYVEGLYNVGVTAGCNSVPKQFCPTVTVTRDQMALFLLKAKHGSNYVPPNVGSSTGFNDVPIDYWAAAWIKQLAAEGITTGCGSGNFCPTAAVTRDQMALFLLKTEHTSSYVPPSVGSSTGFNDVPIDYWAAAWIKQLAAEGITSGCGSGNFCPTVAVTRDQMAVFIDKTFAFAPIP